MSGEIERIRERHEDICKFGIGDTARYAKFMYEDVPRLLEMGEALRPTLVDARAALAEVEEQMYPVDVEGAIRSIDIALAWLESSAEAREDT